MGSNKKNVVHKSLKDYFDQVFDSDTTSLVDERVKKPVKFSHFHKKADPNKVIDIPPVDEYTTETKTTQDTSNNLLDSINLNTSSLSKEELQKIWSELIQLKNVVQEIDFQQKLQKVLDEVDSYIEERVSELDKKLEDFMNRNVPKRKEYDAAGVYKEHVNKVAEYVLDDILVELFDQVPKYTFVGSQVSKLYEDGTICNALITVIVSVIHEGYKYDFKAEVPISNGVALAPLYLQRGLKLIPLTKKDVQEELETMSFVKVNPEFVSKPNLFSHTETMQHRQQDQQKMYPVNTSVNTQQTALPEINQWITQRSRNNEQYER